MSEGRENRFAGVRAQLADKTEQETGRARLRERFAKNEEQDNAKSQINTELAKSEMYKVLIDPDLEPEQKAQKIAELYSFTEEELEKNPEKIAENKAIIMKLMESLGLYNEQFLIQIRDNPLAEIGMNVDDVFSKHHELKMRRGTMDEKLVQIDQVLKDHNGVEGLVSALHSAKDKQVERDSRKASLEAATETVQTLTGDLRTIDGTIATLSQSITEAEQDKLLFFKGAKKAEIAEQKRRLEESRIQREVKNSELTDKQTALQSETTAYQSFVSDSQFQLHERILEILDVNSDNFKDEIRTLAQLTIDTNRETGQSLDESCKQIALVLDRTKKVMAMTQNSSEQTGILLEGINRAQARNSEKLKALEARKEGLSGMEALKHQKVSHALNEHISATSIATKSAALVNQELAKMETGQVAYVGRLDEGLADLEEQKLLSSGTSTLAGVATLSRIESFAAAIPGLIAKGQYAEDSRYALGELHKEFERALSAKMAGNTSLIDFTETLKEVRESMQDRNDVETEIITRRKTLVDDMIRETERLAKVNEDALAVEARVNRELYGTPAAGGGTPQGAVLRMVM